MDLEKFTKISINQGSSIQLDYEVKQPGSVIRLENRRELFSKNVQRLFFPELNGTTFQPLSSANKK